MTTSATTNSELYKNEVKATMSNKHKSLVYRSLSPPLVELCAGFDLINTLFWSQANVNASCTCVLVSRITYDAESACSDHWIWTWIWTLSSTLRLTFHLGSEMKTLSPCSVIACSLSVTSWISSNVMRIPETWSMNCSWIVIDASIFYLFLEI